MAIYRQKPITRHSAKLLLYLPKNSLSWEFSISILNMVSYDLLLFMLKIGTSTRGTSSMPFLVSRRGSFAVQFRDHLQSGDHLRSGIICGAVQTFEKNTPIASWRNPLKGHKNTGLRLLQRLLSIALLFPGNWPTGKPFYLLQRKIDFMKELPRWKSKTFSLHRRGE